ncbi:MAG: VOC family protein [Deltaproteobacteria bacterium]|nr:VOC family protein [Deltaproteobacteria bacterium]
MDHVVFHVQDLARARKFYVDFLGMTIDQEREWQCFLKCGNQGVALFEVDNGQKVRGGSEVNHMALRLKSGNLERVRKMLTEAGIKFHGRAGDPDCVYFHDPDGHQLQLLMPKE